MRILFVSCYPFSDVYANGFMQLVHFVRTGSRHEVSYIPVEKLWSGKKSQSKRITALVPFLRLPVSLPDWALRFLVVFPKVVHNYDLLIIDSDPYTVALSVIIKKVYKCELVIYRQSDPLLFISNNFSLCKKEEILLNIANEIWVPNSLIKDKLPQCYRFKTLVLLNPIKDVFDFSLSNVAENKFEYYKEHVVRDNSFDLIGIYYGKFNIDYELMIGLSKKTPRTKYIVYGNYTQPKQCPANLVFAGFCDITQVIASLKEADFMFIPYSYQGVVNKLLGVSSKILSASKLNKPVIATNVSPELRSTGVYVADNEAEFLSYILRAKELNTPNIDIKKYSFNTIFNFALYRIEYWCSSGFRSKKN